MKTKQHFTQPAPHFTEASLVHTLRGTWHWTTEYLFADHFDPFEASLYHKGSKEYLYVTELGEVVNGIMKESFPSIVDEHFTANMEGTFG